MDIPVQLEDPASCPRRVHLLPNELSSFRSLCHARAPFVGLTCGLTRRRSRYHRAGRVERLVRDSIPGSSWAAPRRPVADTMVRHVGGPGDGTGGVPGDRSPFLVVTHGDNWAGLRVRNGPPQPTLPRDRSVSVSSFFRVFQFPERERLPAGAHDTTRAGRVERLVRG